MSVRITTTYGLSIFCSYPWLYRISCAEATEIKCFQINRYDNKTSNFEALENVWKNKILTSLWFSKMPTTGFTHKNVYLIKLCPSHHLLQCTDCQVITSKFIRKQNSTGRPFSNQYCVRISRHRLERIVSRSILFFVSRTWICMFERELSISQKTFPVCGYLNIISITFYYKPHFHLIYFVAEYLYIIRRMRSK